MADQNRARVLRAAAEAFLQRGYHASVDEIARRAGVAKQTVYHHFPSKDRLFEAAACDLSKHILVELDADPGDVRAALVAFARAYRKRALGAQGLAMFRTLTAEVPRFPGLARAVYQGGAGAMVSRLAAFLRKAMEKGELRRDDPQFAAELFLSMLAGQERVKRLYGINGKAGGAEAEARRVPRIVDCLLRIYRP
ncbi:MAG TPA: TetR/AcrR family transcriptional regulator [Burkholderiales bacterium]|nr:TetR/AcrR family transcriptional regulator [Burkholderiales bacterium]